MGRSLYFMRHANIRFVFLSADNRGVIVYCITGEIIGEIAQEGIFRGGERDQVMFFPSHSTSTSTSATSTSTYSSSTLTRNPVPASKDHNKSINSSDIDSQSNPEFLNKTLRIVETLLRNKVEDEVFRLLFDEQGQDRSYCNNVRENQNTDHQQRRRRQRQSILNLYPPGTGITPHVDLPARYGDGIVGVCLGSGVGVRFVEVDLYGQGHGDGDGDGDGEGLWGDAEEEEEEDGDEGDSEDDTHNDADDQNSAEPALEHEEPRSPPPPSKSSKPNSTNLRKNKKKKRKTRPRSYEVYLPKGTIYILTGEARWSWMHGIEARGEDLVWDDDGGDAEDSESDDDSESEGGSGDSAVDGDGDKPERQQAGRLEETLRSGPSVENSKKRKRTPMTTKSKRTRPRTATRILRDTRVSITYRWLKLQPRQETNRPKEDGDEDEEADEGFGGILLEDPVQEGDDWNVR